MGALVLAGALLSACGGGPAVDKATAPRDIQHAYGVLFNFTNRSVDTKVTVIEGGSSLREALTQGLSSPLASLATGAKVTKTTLLSDAACKAADVHTPCARVTYDVLGARGPLFSGSSGYAVFSDGKWLVARSTVCGLLGTMYTTLGKKGAPPGC